MMTIKESGNIIMNLFLTKGNHEAIIDETTFENVLELIARNPRHNMKLFNGNHILSRILGCPNCGYGMSTQPVSIREESMNATLVINI